MFILDNQMLDGLCLQDGSAKVDSFLAKCHKFSESNLSFLEG